MLPFDYMAVKAFQEQQAKMARDLASFPRDMIKECIERDAEGNIPQNAVELAADILFKAYESIVRLSDKKIRRQMRQGRKAIFLPWPNGFMRISFLEAEFLISDTNLDDGLVYRREESFKKIFKDQYGLEMETIMDADDIGRGYLLAANEADLKAGYVEHSTKGLGRILRVLKP